MEEILSNENIIDIKKNEIEYIQFRKLLEYQDIVQHCFTLKPSTFGENTNYNSLKQLIDCNYKKICNELNIDDKQIIRPYQTHTTNVSSDVSNIGIFPENLQNVDGLITNETNKILSLTFADCTPLLFFDTQKYVIGNIHSGWRGTLNKIGENAVKEMIAKYNCNVKDIICCIGPTIRNCHFEVDEDVKKMFEAKFGNSYIKTGDKRNDVQKYFIDTVGINKKVLKDLGLLEENIIDSKICTVCNSNLIHSYRKEGVNSGRNTALISLK